MDKTTTLCFREIHTQRSPDISTAYLFTETSAMPLHCNAATITDLLRPSSLLSSNPGNPQTASAAASQPLMSSQTAIGTKLPLYTDSPDRHRELSSGVKVPRKAIHIASVKSRTANLIQVQDLNPTK